MAETQELSQKHAGILKPRLRTGTLLLLPPSLGQTKLHWPRPELKGRKVLLNCGGRLLQGYTAKA